MIITRKQFYFFIVMTIFVAVLIPFESNGDVYSAFASVTFWCIGLFSLIMLTRDISFLSFSCSSLHWLFCLFFFFLAPYFQYMANKWPLYYTPTNAKIIQTNQIILLWMIFFELGQKSKKIYKKIKACDKCDYESIPSITLLILLIVLSAICVALMVAKAGLITIISSRTGGETVFTGNNTPTSLLFTYFVRNIITFTALLNVYRYKSNKDNLILMFFSLFLLLIGCSPIGMPRYQAATVYLALLILLFPKWKIRVSFIYSFIFAFIIIFPLLDVFRYTVIQDVDIFDKIVRIIKNIRDYFLTANFDAYTMIMKTLDCVDENGLHYGMQLLGAALFFIPRNLWPNKPVSTGTMIQNSLGWFNAEANVSSSLISEAYIDFGLLGIMIYAFIFGKICKNIDYKIANSSASYNMESTIVFLMPTLLFFLARGPMLSVWGFIVSYIVIGKVSVFLSKKIE